MNTARSFAHEVPQVVAFLRRLRLHDESAHTGALTLASQEPGRSPGLLLCIAAMVSLFLVTPSSLSQVPPLPSVAVPNPERQIRTPQLLPANVPEGFTVAAVGDFIQAYPAAEDRNADFQGMVKLLQGADVAFGNLEETLLNPGELRIWPEAVNGGSALNGPPSIATDIKKMGFDLLSHANNHSTDWGVQGMEATAAAMDDVGLVHAGTGRNKALARAPAYLTTPSGRVALVAMTSTFTPLEPAGAPFRSVTGRPGVNVLRTTAYRPVTAQQMDWLRKNFQGQSRKSQQPGTADELNLFRTNFRVSAGHEPTFTMNPDDLDDILRNIREGKQAANFEIVYIHAHEPSNNSDQPADFLPKLAHYAIDAGADEFVASGPHRLRGIEIYKGKPIFYSLGDFFFEDALIRFLSPDFIEQAHLEAGAVTEYEYQQTHVLPHFDAPIWYQSVVTVSTFDHKGDVKNIKLYPIELGYEQKSPADRGRPRLASPQMAQQILHKLQALSQPFGTRIVIQGNVGVIQVAATKAG